MAAARAKKQQSVRSKGKLKKPLTPKPYRKSKVPDPQLTDDPKPLHEHLAELKMRLIWVVLAYGAAVVLCFLYANEIYQFLVQPLADARGGAEAAHRMIFTSLTEPFTTYIQLALSTGFVLAFPVIAYQLYAFVAPGLYAREKIVFWPFLVAAPVLFLLGAALAYYFVFPLAWKFFLGFEVLGGGAAHVVPIQLEAKIGEYLALTTQLIVAFGLSFQLPIVLTLLAFAGFVSKKGLTAKRKYAIIAIFTFAGVMTPPDVISQIGLAIPLLLLYEISLYCVGIVEQRHKYA